MDTIRYKDGSSAEVARYVVGEDYTQGIDFGLNRRKAVRWAQKQTDFFTGSFSGLSIFGLGVDGVPYAIWNVAYGSVSRRIDP